MSVFSGPYVHPLEMTDAQYDEWLTKIRRGIGGYQISTLMGVGSGTPLDVYKSFLDMADREPPTPAMQRGIAFEDDALDLFHERTGMRPEIPSHEDQFIRSPTNKFFVGQVDAFGTANGRVVPTDWGRGIIDAKVPAAFFFGEWVTGGVPEYVWMQCQWYMGHLGLRWAAIACLDYENWRLLGDDEPPVIPFDEAAYDLMTERANKFLHNHIFPRIAPEETPADDHAIDVPVIGNEEVRLTEPSHIAVVTRLFEAREEAKLIDEKVKRYRAQIEAIMEELDAGTITMGDNRKIHWKPSERRSIDTAKVLDAIRRAGLNPDDFYKVSQTRPFRPVGG